MEPAVEEALKKKETQIAALQAKIKDAKLKKVNPQLAKKKPELFLQPMSNWHLYSEYKNGHDEYLMLNGTDPEKLCWNIHANNVGNINNWIAAY